MIETEGRLTRINCDGDGCHKNYEGMDGFQSAWAEAKLFGWVNSCEVYNNITTWRHYCPRCKLDLGDD